MEFGIILLRIDLTAQLLDHGGHIRIYAPAYRIWRGACMHRRHIGLPDFKSRYRWPFPTESRQHR